MTIDELNGKTGKTINDHKFVCVVNPSLYFRISKNDYEYNMLSGEFKFDNGFILEIVTLNCCGTIYVYSQDMELNKSIVDKHGLFGIISNGTPQVYIPKQLL